MRKKSSLDQIDGYFVAKSEKEAKNYYMIAGAVVVLLIYLGVFPMAEEYFNTQQDFLNKATQNLSETRTKFIEATDGINGSDENFKINKTQQLLQSDKNQLQSYRESNKYFDNKLREVSNLTYNQKNWAKFLDSLTTLAENNNIKISFVNSETNSMLDLNLADLKPEAVLNVKVGLEGDFGNILRYINSVEQSEMIVDVNGLDINKTAKSSSIGGNMNIAIWGIKYQ